MTEKQELRRLFRRRRRESHGVEAAIQAAALDLIQGASPGHVGLYWPLPGEVDLLNLVQQISAPIALPRADGQGGLQYLSWSGDQLEPDGCRIPAPRRGAALQPNQLSLLLIPALAIDAAGIRLGYGGGYYDRLRADPAWAAVPAWAVLPSACLSASPLPRDDWDVPFQGWITERGPGRP